VCDDLLTLLTQVAIDRLEERPDHEGVLDDHLLLEPTTRSIRIEGRVSTPTNALAVPASRSSRQ
jgi:hypothetical protein